MSLSFSTYRGNYVFHPIPVWNDHPGKIDRPQIGDIGTPFGYTYSQEIYDFPQYSANFVYNFVGMEDIWTVNSLFDTLKGAFGNIWFPSWMADFKIDGDIGSSDTTIDITMTEDFDTYYPLARGTGRYVFIYINNSTWFARRITGYSSSTITIDSSLGTDFSQDQIKFLSFLYMGRLDIQTIEWVYQTPTVATCQLYFIELPNEYTSTSTSTTTTTTTA